MLFMFVVPTGAEQLFATDVTTAAEGYSLLGTEGKFIVDTYTALKQFQNEW